jgi:peptidoglycan/LPS O-acetylase OafA/YrhL
LSAHAANQPAQRLDALDGLRGLAALSIAVLHVWMFDYGDSGRPDKSLFDHVIGEARLGVPLFFVLSGFLLYRPYVRAALDGRPARSVGRYAVRRAARILPGYWLALAVSFGVLRALDHAGQVGWGELPLFVLFLQNYVPSTLKHLNPPMWTLCIEVSFYVALPLFAAVAARAGRRRSRHALLCAALVALGLGLTALAALEHWPPTVTSSLLRFVPDFGLGMLVAVLVHRRTATRRLGLALATAGIALVVVNGWWHAYTIGPQMVREVVADAPALVGFALVVAALVLAGLRPRILCSAPVQLAGTLSYGVYLLHFLVIYVLRALDRWPEHLGLALLAVLGLTLPAAAVSWLAVERPVLRWSRRATGRAAVAHRQPARPQARHRPEPAPARS